jgi:non-ribosomal peptide synthetase component F
MTTSLAQIINEMGVTSVGLTSSTASLLNPDLVPGLKQITLTGELIDPQVVETWASKVHVRNAYGLSECTQINMGRQLTAGSNPRIVGRPSDTTSAYVLIPGTTKLAPLLVQGELCLGGYQLGQGYLNRPDLTDKVFIPNPFGPGRLYRTGDLAVCYEDGSLEILGRIDYQMKINGQRVEPAEVAAVLQAYKDVSAAGVIGATISGRKCLVACIVADASISQDEIPSFIDRVRRHASDHLPVYMLPSYYLPLSDLPRNANGKLDIANARKKAEELGREGLLAAISRSDARAVKSGSVSPHMIVLRQIVAEVLSIPASAVIVTESFLFLGGSSLDAIRVSMEALKQGLHVEAGDLIKADSFETLLQDMADAPEQGDPEPFSMLKEKPSFLAEINGVLDAFPVTPMQEGVLAALLQGDSSYIYQRAYDVGGHDMAKLRSAMQTVLEQRPLLRTTFFEHGDSFVQVVRDGVELVWEEHEMDVAEYKDFDAKRSMEFGGSFWRVAVLRRNVLVVSMHHVLFDYWSHRFFFEDVASVYLKNSQIPPRAPLSRFVAQTIRSDKGRDKQFWTGYLENVHPSILGKSDDHDAHSVSKNIKVDLKAVKAQHGLTTGPIIYAAWALVLSKHVNSEDVVFATTLSGRDRPVVDIQSLDGPTLTTVPQRMRLGSDTVLADLVKTVQNTLWEVSKHAQYGMRGALRAAHQGNAKLFDTMVNYLTPEVVNQAVREVFKPHGPKNVWLSEYQTLELQEVVTGEEFNVVFNSGLDKRRAGFILDQFENALRLIGTDPTATVGKLALMSEREYEFLHSLYPQVTIPPPSFLHASFEMIAETEPNRSAIQWLDEPVITYRDLDMRANRLAHYLQAFIEPGDIIALLLDKSPLMIVSILAVMKAGGAYVPLSPENPSVRNNFIIQDVRSKILITESHHMSLTAPATISIDKLDVSAFPATRPQIPRHAPSDPAYVIYTSGSTGKLTLVPYTQSTN